MNRHSRMPLTFACIALLALAGCAKPRTGPFDVPVAVPSSVPVSPAPFDDGVQRAAAEISSQKIYFAFDRAELGPEAYPILDRIASLLKGRPEIRISIQGHCDERGSRNYNFDLGDRRARAAYSYLVQCGVSPAQLDMVTYGEITPAVPARTEPDHARNRRGEFVVLTTCAGR